MRGSSWVRGFALAGCTYLAAAACDDGGARPTEVPDGGEPSSSADAGDAQGDSPEPVTPCVADASEPVPSDRCTTDPSNSALPACEQWLKVEPEGAQCGNGSQYKFFVNYSNKSNHLVVM